MVSAELCEYHNCFELSIHSGILNMHHNHIFKRKTMILFIFCYRKSGFSKSVRSYAFLSLSFLFVLVFCFLLVNYFILIYLLFCKARNPISVNCSIVSILPP